MRRNVTELQMHLFLAQGFPRTVTAFNTKSHALFPKGHTGTLSDHQQYCEIDQKKGGIRAFEVPEVGTRIKIENGKRLRHV